MEPVSLPLHPLSVKRKIVHAVVAILSADMFDVRRLHPGDSGLSVELGMVSLGPFDVVYFRKGP